MTITSSVVLGLIIETFTAMTYAVYLTMTVSTTHRRAAPTRAANAIHRAAINEHGILMSSLRLRTCRLKVQTRRHRNLSSIKINVQLINLKKERSLKSRIETSDVNFIIALVKADYVINYAEVVSEFTSLNWYIIRGRCSGLLTLVPMSILVASLYHPFQGFQRAQRRRRIWVWSLGQEVFI